MSARMSFSVWQQGFVGAAACVFGVAVFWLGASLLIPLVSDGSSAMTLAVGCALLWGALFLAFFIGWLHEWNASGNLLVDCGLHPAWGVFVLNAGVFLLVALSGCYTATAFSPIHGLAGCLFGTSIAIYWIIMASGRLQLRETGLWAYWGLVPWTQIEHFYWESDRMLVLHVRSRVSRLHQGRIPVPADDRPVIDQLIRQCCSRAT